MIRLLSDTLATFNAAFAVLITLGGGLAGWRHMYEQGTAHGVLGIALGLVIGLAFAAAICGTLATLVLIENHLRNLLRMAERDRTGRRQ
ncbi:hypothetical protein [Mesorhizobium sp. J8]|uniref:hypothetical protein n=1 Tax=Mesorhizobium sp. J8 TaxID=2777475 RepID=UPI00191653DC|nr:hypothetical protein [Mesorhizobium sp. J8]BCM19178.1 hypothetical protein MJ8_29500 [Mesorhizobium sp. J8]